MRSFVFIFSCMFLLTSCGLSKHLVYIDDWQGNYTMREYNSCCDSATQVKMELRKTNANEYTWKLFFTRSNADTIYGKAIYQKNKLNFVIINTEVANRYFENAVSSTAPVFRMEYDSYDSNKDFSHVGHYTRWSNELRDYKQGRMLFAGISYHFKKDGQNESRQFRKT